MAQVFFKSESNRDIPVSPSEPLPVQVPAEFGVTVKGTLHETEWVQVPYGATSGALDANDALGDVFMFTGVPCRGRILSVKMLDLDDDTLAATIHVFNANISAAASDAAYTVGIADARKMVTAQPFDAGTDEGGFKYHEITDVNTDYVADSGTLYAQLSSTGTPNIASAAVMPLVKLFILPLE